MFGLAVSSFGNHSVVSDAPLYPNQDRGALLSMPMPVEPVAVDVLIVELKERMNHLVDALHHEQCQAYPLSGGTTFSAITLIPGGKGFVSYVGDSPVYMATRSRASEGPWIVRMLNKGLLHVPDPKKLGFELATDRPIKVGIIPGTHDLRLLDCSGRPCSMMTRSLGDHNLRADFYINPGHSHELTHLDVDIAEGEQAIFIAASDGVSDKLSEERIAEIVNSADPMGDPKLIAEGIVASAGWVWHEDIVQAMRDYLKGLSAYLKGNPQHFPPASFSSLYAVDDLDHAPKYVLVDILKEIDACPASRGVLGTLASFVQQLSSDDITATCVHPDSASVKVAFVLDGHGGENGAVIAQRCLEAIAGQFPSLLRDAALVARVPHSSSVSASLLASEVSEPLAQAEASVSSSGASAGTFGGALVGARVAALPLSSELRV